MKDKYNTYHGKSYRFISFDGLFKTIENKSLRFARTDTFNDPLDASPYLFNYNWKIFENFDPRILEQANKKAYEMVFSTTYVCAFSTTYYSKKSYLMWSHYANSHSEVCFEIDFSKIDYLGGPSKVTYQNNLAEKRISVKNHPEELGLFLLTNKSKVWKYEKEVRLICDTKVAKKKHNISVSQDKKHIFIKFEPKIISKIIFGQRATEQNISKTINLFESLNLSPTFEQMVLSPTSLELIPKKLNIK